MLQTIPVIVKSRTKKLNAQLDNAGTRTSTNADVAAELGLQGRLQRVTVGVLNDKTETFKTCGIPYKVLMEGLCLSQSLYSRQSYL